MAKEKSKGSALGSIKASAGSFLSRLPFAKGKSESSPEPFSAVEDETPLGDLLQADNAAPLSPARDKAERLRPEIGETIKAAAKNPFILYGGLCALGFGLIIAAVAVIVSSPPKAASAPAPITREGTALVKTWLPPPGDPLAPRMEMERDEAPDYGAADAARLGIPNDPLLKATLAECNDEAIEELYGTVP